MHMNVLYALDIARERRERAIENAADERRFSQPRQFEQLASKMSPACGFGDRSRLAVLPIKAVEVRIGVGLHDAGVGRELLLWVLAFTVG